MKQVALKRTERLAEAKKAWAKNKYKYLMILPAILVTIIFHYIPFFGISIAFMDYDIIDGFGSDWVGWKNFADIFGKADIWLIVLRTLYYNFFLIFVNFPLPIILALMFNELTSNKFKRVAQTLTYLPHFISMVTVVGLFYGMLSMNGTINDLLAKIVGEGYVRKNIMLDSNYFLSIIFTANIWKGIGWSSIIYLSAIAGIDSSLYEAASIDGCGRLRQTWHITLPGIAGTVVILFIMKFGNIVTEGFELVYNFQNLYTQKDTEIIGTYVYRLGIVNGDYSHATAFGLAQGLTSVTLVLLANKISKKITSIGIF